MSKAKENKQASYYINKAKDAMDDAVQELEEAGRAKEAEQLYRMILRLEEWQRKHV